MTCQFEVHIRGAPTEGLDSCIQVLTGDRQETAINVGYSCRLMDTASDLLILNESSLDATREALRMELEGAGGGPDITLVIDGQTLKYALACDCRQVTIVIRLVPGVLICPVMFHSTPIDGIPPCWAA